MAKRLINLLLLALALGIPAAAFAAGATAPTPVLPTPVPIVEFYNAALDHYFISADPAEIAALDRGTTRGWVRTGYQFTGYAAYPVNPLINTVCRFYGRPEAGLDSHFYSASLEECAAVASKFAASWKLESGDVFQVKLPDQAGSCPGMTPVYRLFNNRRDANHRYTADPAVRDQMVSSGYVSEGYGRDGVAFCVVATTSPPAQAPTSVSISVTAISPDSYDFSSTAVTANNVAIVSYMWDFGDGSTATGATSSHTYTASGAYTVALTALDSKGARATSKKSVTAAVAKPPSAPPSPPRVGPPGSWTRYAVSYEAGTEAPNQSWYNLAYDSKRDLFYGLSWWGSLSAFDPKAGLWHELTPRIASDVHNRTTTYDPINDRVWIGIGTGRQLKGVNYYDLNTGQYVSHPLSGRGHPGSESAMIFDPVGKRFVIFGGWGALKVHTLALDPPATVSVDAGVPGGPAYDSDARKMTAWRSALDSKRQRIVYVDTDGSLWSLPLALSRWEHVATSGGPPPAYTQYVYDAAHDALVGWSASPRVAQGDPIPGTTRETWLLPLATLKWSKAANVAAGDTVPGDTVYVGYAMAYDPVRRQTLLHTLGGSGNYGPSTWAYRYPDSLPGQPPAPPPQPPAPPQPPPPPPSVVDARPITAGIFVARTLPPIGKGVWGASGSSKHLRWVARKGLLYQFGGDFTTPWYIDSENQMGFSYDVATNTWANWTPRCHGPGKVTPSHPDQLPFIYDSRRDTFWSLGGIMTGPDNAPCVSAPKDPYSISGSTLRQGLLRYDWTTRDWTMVEDKTRIGTNALHAQYDPVRDEMIYIRNPGGFGGEIVRLRLSDLTQSVTPFRNGPTPAFVSPFRDGWTAAEAPQSEHFAIDPVGRKAYIVSHHQLWANGAFTGQRTLRFWEYDLDTFAIRERAAPPMPNAPLASKESLWPEWDSKNRVVLLSVTNDPCGVVRAFDVYDPAADRWTEQPIVQPDGLTVRGNSAIYDPANNVMMIGGSVFCDAPLPHQSNLFLYRYK